MAYIYAMTSRVCRAGYMNTCMHASPRGCRKPAIWGKKALPGCKELAGASRQQPTNAPDTPLSRSANARPTPTATPMHARANSVA
jgi:hypothetical protein